MKSAIVVIFGLCAMAETGWRELAPMPAGVAGGAAGMVHGKLYYAGGTAWMDGVKHTLQDVRIFDPEGNSWTGGPALPEPFAYGGFVTTPGGLELLGGMSRNCWRLHNRFNKSWTRSGTLPQDGALARAESINGSVYLFGGCPGVTDLTQCSETVWRRDKPGAWSQAGPMPDGRVALRASAVVSGSVYLFGGCTAESPTAVRNTDQAWRFDPAANRWHKLKPLEAPVRSASAIALDKHRILLAGGYTDSGFSNAVRIYDTVLDRYDAAKALPFPVAGLSLVAHGETVIGLGGEDKMRSRSNRVVEFHPPSARSSTLDAR